MLADVVAVVGGEDEISLVQDAMVSQSEADFVHHFVDALQGAQPVAVPLVVVLDVCGVLLGEVGDPGRSPGAGVVWVESCASGDLGGLEEVFVAFGGDGGRLDGGGARVVSVDVVVDDVDVAVRRHGGDCEHEGLFCFDGVV